MIFGQLDPPSAPAIFARLFPRKKMSSAQVGLQNR